MRFQKYILVAPLFALFLASCGQVDLPEDVLTRAKQALVSVESGNLDVAISLQASGQDELDMQANLELAFDQADEDSDRDFRAHVILNGVMEVLDETFNANLDAELVHLNSEYYVLLNVFDSTDDDLQLIMPFANLYKGRWLHIDNDSIPESIRSLDNSNQASDEATRQQLRDLFVQSNIFVIEEDRGTKKIDGHEAFHLNLALDPDAFRDYLTSASALNGSSFTTTELEEVIDALGYFESIEVYIDTETFDVYKIILKLSTAAKLEADKQLANGEDVNGGIAAPDTEVSTDDEMVLEITLSGSDYNQVVEVQAPETYDEFNPLNILMGLGNLPLPSDEDSLELNAEDGTSSRLGELDQVEDDGEE